ncbi:hypothetical protein ACWCOW_26340 [Streptomyces sp. NPDC001939]|uniref:hypothetical protein n=1 Tax=Streptomyces sp. NBC_00401 TaxID=2975738 RepID=UPI002258757E|nr:hypothetical protein [Streptomyces sp. NBC_00401]MCX5082027.1 hypothetical protein [Streptomyces sp. NBC_00401]
MTDAAPVMTTPSPARDARWKVPAAVVVVLLVLGGLGGWLLWPDEEPVVAVPAKVCEASLPGGAVKGLVPERGEKFREENAYNFATAGHSPEAVRRWGLGQCQLTGGGASVKVEYRLLQGGDYTRADVDTDARESGSTPLALGAAGGYLKGPGAHLFVDCPVRPGGDELLEVSVGVGGNGADEKDRAVRSSASALAADAARHVARDIRRCPGAENLPSGPPRIG